MLVNGISHYNILNLKTSSSSFYNRKVSTPVNSHNDVFEKSYATVSFTSNVKFVSNVFETKYNKTFFKKLLREDIIDAYTGKRMVPREDIDYIKEIGNLNKKSQVAIKTLKPYKDAMYPTEKEIFTILENLSKRHPNMNLQELLQLRYENAEETLVNQQAQVLNKINLISKKLSKSENLQIRKLIQSSFDKIFAQDPLPEARFTRKRFLSELKQIPITDAKKKQKILKEAEKLPQSSSSISAFIVKYSQPYKVKYTTAEGDFVRIPRTSEDIGLRLLEPSIATAEHIYPQTLYSQEEKFLIAQGVKGDALKQMRVSILTSKGINEVKSDTTFDDFVKSRPEHIVENIKSHISNLVLIADRWKKNGRYEDAATLADYIVLLRDEFAKRSKLVSIDLGDFEARVPEFKRLASTVTEKKAKRVKKTGHADNSHRETYIGPNGEPIKNRKIHKHTSRFS